LQLPSYHKTLRSVSVGATIARRGESCNATFRPALNAWTSRVPSATGRARALQAGDPPTRRASCWPKGVSPISRFAPLRATCARFEPLRPHRCELPGRRPPGRGARRPWPTLPDARCAGLEAVLADLLRRHSANTVLPATRRCASWAAGWSRNRDGARPCRQGQATIVPEQAVPIVLEEGLLAVCADKGTPADEPVRSDHYPRGHP
jgi:hypothetical protein